MTTQELERLEGIAVFGYENHSEFLQLVTTQLTEEFSLLDARAQFFGSCYHHHHSAAKRKFLERITEYHDRTWEIIADIVKLPGVWRIPSFEVAVRQCARFAYTGLMIQIFQKVRIDAETSTPVI